MKKILLLFTLMALFGCDRNAFLERQDQKLVGIWELKRVRKSSNGNIFTENVTQKFEGMKISFYEDNTMEWNIDNQNWVGDYNLFYYADIYSGEEGSENALRLEATLHNSNSEEMKLFLENMNITQNRLRFNNREEGKSYEFTFKR